MSASSLRSSAYAPKYEAALRQPGLRPGSPMAERFTKHGAKILSFFCLSGIHAGFFSI
jgi:hypothetical protein